MPHKTQFSEYDLDWLLAPTPSSTDEIGIERQYYPLEPDLGSAWVESLRLRDGITLFRAVHALENAPRGHLVHLMDVTATPETSMFNAQIWLSGLCCHREYWQGVSGPPVDIIASPGQDTFRFHGDWRCSIFVEGGQTSEMRSVVMPAAMLDDLLGDEGSHALRRGLGLDGKRLTSVVPMPGRISAPLKEAMAGHVCGIARKLYAQARVLDYLAILLTAVNGPDRTGAPARNLKKTVNDLHDHLIHLEGRLPTLSELANEYGIPARRLNDGFTAEFGASIYNFMTDRRLLQAHASILASDIPLKVLAARLGYSHVNHFIVAFKRRFGYSPGTLRK